MKEGRRSIKCYGVIFTCLVSRAVHIETANSLDINSFINSLRRFVARRGGVKVIRCDNGTNFRGTEKEFKRCFDEVNNDQTRSFLLKHEIEWQFNPPAASHMGGVWERQIRTIRKCLSPLLQQYSGRLDGEGYRTLLTEVECIINSRPLTAISDSPDDLEPLTPSHLLTLRSHVTSPPPGEFVEDDMYGRKRWRYVQYLSNVFWKRWKREYLVTLQQRQKWSSQKPNIKIGDVVLVKDENEPRCVWSMGKVVVTNADEKGIVRSVKLKVRGSEISRPIQKLVLLLSD